MFQLFHFFLASAIFIKELPTIAEKCHLSPLQLFPMFLHFPAFSLLWHLSSNVAKFQKLLPAAKKFQKPRQLFRTFEGKMPIFTNTFTSSASLTVDGFDSLSFFGKNTSVKECKLFKNCTTNLHTLYFLWSILELPTKLK